MSGRLKGKRAVVVENGAGMLEFLVALLVFSLGMLGLLSVQVVGKKAGFEAVQRSIATVLARDILERMRANPALLDAYQVEGLGDPENRLPVPETNCDTAACSAQQLAQFDMWQWESLLHGESENDTLNSTGGLINPRACIGAVDRDVDITISWRGVLRDSNGDGFGVAADCMGEAKDDSGGGQEGGAPRHQLSVVTFIAGP